MNSVVPAFLQGALWSRRVNLMDVQRDAPYIVHQVLSRGSWEQVRWVFGAYGLDEIKNIFLHCPAKNYTEKTFNFFSRVVLGIPSGDIDTKNYVKTFPRIIG